MSRERSGVDTSGECGETGWAGRGSIGILSEIPVMTLENDDATSARPRAGGGGGGRAGGTRVVGRASVSGGRGSGSGRRQEASRGGVVQDRRDADPGDQLHELPRRQEEEGRGGPGVVRRGDEDD